MRAVHAVPGIAHKASGPSNTVPALCAALHRHGVEISLHCIAPRPDLPGFPAELHVHDLWPHNSKLWASPSMRRALAAEARRADIMHSHSLFMLMNVYPGWAVRGTACKLVVSPRGTLAPWALQRSAWRKRLVWWGLQRDTVMRAACLHATAPDEAEDIRRVGYTGPITVIPNGVDVPTSPLPRPPRPGRRQVLFLSRIHPKKGIPLLLEAWRPLEAEFPAWDLAIRGPDDGGHLAEVRGRAGSLQLQRVTFGGPLFGAAKAQAYAAADVFILPTHSENFGVVVAEALAAGTPAIVSKGAPWAGLAARRCGWWVETSAESLRAALREAMVMPPGDLAAMGRRGWQWMRDEFSWDHCAAQMKATYAWILGQGPRPDCTAT